MRSAVSTANTCYFAAPFPAAARAFWNLRALDDESVAGSSPGAAGAGHGPPRRGHGRPRGPLSLVGAALECRSHAGHRRRPRAPRTSGDHPRLVHRDPGSTLQARGYFNRIKGRRGDVSAQLEVRASHEKAGRLPATSRLSGTGEPQPLAASARGLSPPAGRSGGRTVVPVAPRPSSERGVPESAVEVPPTPALLPDAGAGTPLCAGRGGRPSVLAPSAAAALSRGSRGSCARGGGGNRLRGAEALADAVGKLGGTVKAPGGLVQP